MEKRYYIAYGSNLNIWQMNMRCPAARIMGTSKIPDYRLLFRGSGSGAYLTIEPEKGYSVPVVIWSVTGKDEQALDRYEGYPAFYYKKEMVLPVTGIGTGKVHHKKAFVYIMHEERDFGIPTSYYLQTCMEGYHTFGFEPDTLMEAVAFSRERVEGAV